MRGGDAEEQDLETLPLDPSRDAVPAASRNAPYERHRGGRIVVPVLVAIAAAAIASGTTLAVAGSRRTTRTLVLSPTTTTVLSPTTTMAPLNLVYRTGQQAR